VALPAIDQLIFQGRKMKMITVAQKDAFMNAETITSNE
jgi:hypothetical protein